MMLRKAFSRLKRLLLYLIAWGIVRAEAQLNSVRALFVADSLILDAVYDGRPILLLALYEKGQLREDVEKLLCCAKQHGVYTLCINTSRLDNPHAYEALMDGYIERYNHGRDFGSYRTGFLHIYRRRWDQGCPRLLMLNDSVFYASRGLKMFLADMYGTSMEVLGATENHEVEHHLGSFCLSLSQAVLSHGVIKRYWRTYRSTDFRRAVIKRGEMALTKKLKSIVSSPQKIGALYNTPRYLQALTNDNELLKNSIELVRRSERVRWPRFDHKSFVVDMFHQNILHDELHHSPLFSLVCDYNSMVSALSAKSTASKSRLEDAIKAPLIGCLAQTFNQGSQIHQNAAVLVYMGLPIVKLDGIYRGLFSIRDVKQITDLLDERDLERLTTLLLSKPYGGDTLFGWKQEAFNRWLI